MPKPLTPRQRLDQAKEFIQQARVLPEPPGLGYSDLTFVAQVKDLLRQARDLVKFLHYSPSLNGETRAEYNAIIDEIVQAEKEILHRDSA
jgi:hypothetical protein